MYKKQVVRHRGNKIGQYKIVVKTHNSSLLSLRL